MPIVTKEDVLFTPPEVAKLLEVRLSTIYYYIKTDKLPLASKGRPSYIRGRDVERYVKSLK